MVVAEEAAEALAALNWTGGGTGCSRNRSHRSLSPGPSRLANASVACSGSTTPPGGVGFSLATGIPECRARSGDSPGDVWGMVFTIRIAALL